MVSRPLALVLASTLSLGLALGACSGSSSSLAPASDAGADSTTSGHACVPGQQVACTCTTGAAGDQVCAADGNDYGPCTCGPITDATLPDGNPSPLADGGAEASSSDASLLDGAAGDASGDAGPCPAGLVCNVSCDAGATTVTGTVYDPAGKNRLANVFVYVPASPLAPLTPRGVSPVDGCACSALYPGGALTSTVTASDGTFTLTNVPAGSQVPLVLQIGKWRRKVPISVTGCTSNPQTDGSLALPGSIPAGDTDDNMPDIAVSTGGADSLECLLYRMGVSKLEYVAGGATTGHVHVFSGGAPGSGAAEKNSMAGAPSSWADGGLWDSANDLMAYDLVLLSCEGNPTANANPAALETYLNGGGRVIASHFHYEWFEGSSAPSDWGANLATWTSAGGGAVPTVVGGIVNTTLNGLTTPFPKGVTFAEWLGDAGALGQDGVVAGELSVYQARFNATVGAANTHSQPWLVADSTSGSPGSALAFSFDTPVNGPASSYCGRAMYTDLHVSGVPGETDTVNTAGGSPPPDGCDLAPLSAQEKALEYMVLDMASCVVPDTASLATDAGIP